jgi:3-hydroxymyristoyl/3-hydroxydecanoyl-(acyl carrier protein) dehydratase
LVVAHGATHLALIRFVTNREPTLTCHQAQQPALDASRMKR